VDEFETVPLYRSDLLFNESSDDPASFLLDAFRQQAHGKKIDPFSLIQEFVGSVPNNGSQASKNQPTFKSTPVLNTKMVIL
jgi:hypothetical protein